MVEAPADDPQGRLRPVVEERRHLLRGRRAVRRRQRRRRRRLPRPHRQGRLPGRPRGDLHLADAVLPDPEQGQRLRHQRLLRRRPPAGNPRRRRRVPAGGPRARHPGDRRPGRQPHLRPAPWFQSARAEEASPFRDFYVWADEQPDGPKDVVFPDAEDSNWDYDEVAGKWFLHRFYSHMPDLNIANPRVRDEITKVVGYWLELGLSGFRVDAAPFVIEQTGSEAERLQDPHAFLRDLRAFLNRRRGDAILVAEANLPPDDQRRFF